MDVNPFQYCGEYFDAETETVYLRNRHYNPRLGRFSAVDPAKDGLNWYTYCGGNPLRFVDPLGLAREQLDRTPDRNMAALKSRPRGRDFWDNVNENPWQGWYEPPTGYNKTTSTVYENDWSGTYYSKEDGYTGITITKEFMNQVAIVSEKHGINPDDLMTLMASESRIATRISRSGSAAGLIQFANVSNYGYSVAEVANLNEFQQLELVDKYFADRLAENPTADPSNIIDLYTLMFLPATGGYGQGDFYVLANKTDRYTWAYNAQPRFDTNNDGVIDRGDLKRHISNQLEDYRFNLR